VRGGFEENGEIGAGRPDKRLDERFVRVGRVEAGIGFFFGWKSVSTAAMNPESRFFLLDSLPPSGFGRLDTRSPSVPGGVTVSAVLTRLTASPASIL
jgi:hypothetical protein